jgi:hypothetical protein
MMLVASSLAITHSPAHALFRLQHLWAANATVTAVAVSGDTAYIGGEFTYVGPVTGPLVITDLSAGARVDEGFVVNGGVFASVPDGEGGWYVGGDFTEFNGLAREGLAHVRHDLTVDPWSPGVAGVQSLAIAGDTLFVGGQFTAAAGQLRRGLAAFDVPTGTLLGWDPTMLSDGTYYCHVKTMVVSDSLVYVGGNFSSCGGEPRANIVAWIA